MITITPEELTEVSMEIQNGSETVEASLSSEQNSVEMQTLDNVIVVSTKDYSKLVNKPILNGWTLNSGENSLDDVGIQTASYADINRLF